jgi:tetratricopeptide (TPR) repeat protein
MHQYGVSDVEKLLRLPRSTIRAFIAAGFVTPRRGPRNAWLFSFQDLIALRTAQALAAAKVPKRRITNSVKELRRHLPDTMPLSGLRICAVGDRVVVREGASRWQADSGQYLLAFDGDPDNGSLSVTERPPAALPGRNARGWFKRAVALEREDTTAALNAYEQALALEPAYLDAFVNLGRLLHEIGQPARAEEVYRKAMRLCDADPVLFFNLGVLLHDAGRKSEAVQMYEIALECDPDLADGHYNLALLYEELGQPKEAIRHMSQYRRLVKAESE